VTNCYTLIWNPHSFLDVVNSLRIKDLTVTSFFRPIASVDALVMHMNVSRIKSHCWCSTRMFLPTHRFWSNMMVSLVILNQEFQIYLFQEVKIPTWNLLWGQILRSIVLAQPLSMAKCMFLGELETSRSRYVMITLKEHLINYSDKQNKRMLAWAKRTIATWFLGWGMRNISISGTKSDVLFCLFWFKKMFQVF